MMHRPWASGAIDEWLPRSLRLCWGGDSSDGSGGFGGAATGGGDWGSAGSGGFGGSDFGGGIGGWGGDSFGGAATGGGDWGSAGAYDASNAMGYTDAASYAAAVAASPGGFYDTGGAGLAPGALGAEFGGTFGLGGISGQPGDPMGAFGAELDAGGGGLSGVGRAIESWGRDTPATQAGYVGSFADLSGGFGGVGSPGTGGGYSGTGGGLFGDYGGGYTGGGRSSGFTGGGFTGGGTTSGGSSGGGRGGGVSRGSSPSVTSPYADDTGPQGRGESEVSSPYADDTGPTGRGEQDTVEGAPEAAPEAATPASTFGTPATSTSETTSDEPGPSVSTPAPEATPSASREATPDYQGSPYADMGPSAFGPQSLDRGTPDYQGSPYADMGPSQAYTDATQALSDLTQSALSPQDVNWGSVFEGAAAPQVEPGSRDFLSVSPGFWGNVFNAVPAWAQNAPDFTALANPGTWLSPTNQQTFNEIANLPGTLYSALNPSVPTMLQAPSTMDLQALGEQDKAGQITDLATQLGEPDIGAPQGVEPGAEQYGTESYAPGGIDPGATQYATAPDPATQLGIESIAPVDWGSVFEAPAQAPDWASVFEGAAPSAEPDWGSMFEGAPSAEPDWASVFEGAPTSPDWTSVFEGTAPSYDETMDPASQTAAPPSTDDTATPGGDPALSGASVDAANAAANAAQNANASPQAANAAAQAAQNAALNGATPTEQAVAAARAALDADPNTTQAQADAIAGAVYDAASRGPSPEISGKPGAVPGLTLEMLASPEVRGFLPSYDPANIAIQAVNQAILAPTTQEQPAAPAPGPEPGPEPTSTTQAQPQTAPPGLLEQAQPSTQATIPGGRTTDFNYPSSTSKGIEPGAEQYGVDDDDDAPEPPDTQQSHDPNAPRPPSDIPGQLTGQNGRYQNAHADTPQTSRTYSNSGRTDYPQGRPGVDFRTVRQSGVVPDFQVQDINIKDLDTRLVENINRAVAAMRAAGITDHLVASSGMRFAHRGEALEHMNDPRLSQESVYSRGNPTHGRSFPAARPGGSNHGHGRAIDFDPAQSGRALSWLRANAGRFSLEHLRGNFDMPHIQLSGARGNVGARPSAQEQAEQRALDAQNRQTAIALGLIGGGGRATQLAGAPTPRGRPAEAPQLEVAAGGIQPGAEQYSVDVPPAAALPPVAPPEPAPAPRPPADIPIDIPVQTVPPRAGRADPVVLGRVIKEIAAKAIEGISPQTTREQAAAKGATGRAALMAAGVPAPMARAAMLDTATKTAIAMGYGPNYTVLGINMWSTVQGKIAEAVDQAMQGYQPAKQGEVQGPPAPADLVTPGKRSEAPFGFHFAAGGRDAGEPSAIEPELPGPGLPGRAEWDAPLPGGIFPGLNIEAGAMDPRSGTVLDPSRAGRGPVFDPDIFSLQQQEQQQYQQQFDPRGWRALAKGGRVDDDEPVVVGEEGPEVFVPDRPGTVVPHMPPGGGGDFGRWPKLPTPDYPGRYAGVGREMKRQMRTAQDPVPGLMDMIDSGRLRLNAANWQRMINDPSLIALGRSRIEDRRAYSHDYPY